MNHLFSIKQAASITNMTSEALRHYDRIGLVKPSLVDPSSQYRYYSERELVRLQTVGLLKQMDLTLTEIKEVLDCGDLNRVVGLLKQAEKNADEKIARLQYAKSKIQLARDDYEKKLDGADPDGEDGAFFVKRLPSRAILISDRLETPTLESLWDYHRHFYRQIGDASRSQYLFEDQAGMITAGDRTRLFAVCVKYPSAEKLTILPEGDYLCGNCTEEDRDAVIRRMLEKLGGDSCAPPRFILQNIVVIGVLQWRYQVQMPLR